MRTWQKVLLGLVLTAIAIFAMSFIFDAKYQINEYSEYTHQPESGYHHFGPYVLLVIANFLRPYSELVTAIGTLAIAAFTWTLWQTSQDQGRLTETALVESRRAFVFGGGLYPEWFFDPALKQYTWRFRPIWVNSG